MCTRRYTHARYVVVAAHPFGQQPVPDLPSEDGRTLALVVGDLVHHAIGGHARFRAANGARFDRTGFVIPIKKNTHRGNALKKKIKIITYGNSNNR